MLMQEQVDKAIIGAGLYGLYAALYAAQRGERVCVLECDAAAFGRATYVNQARVHQGYHYPRSLATACKSAGYFARFNREFPFCVHREFAQIYAIARAFSWTNAQEFLAFCRAADIPCEAVPVERYFAPHTVDGAFLTREYTYDAQILRDYFLEQLAEFPDTVRICYGARVTEIEEAGENYLLRTENGLCVRAPFVLNATYAGTNEIAALLGFPSFRIKYELCEIILGKAKGRLRDTGITVMDGPFFSVMPFGKTGFHSLTAVSFTPHEACFEPLPRFACQERAGDYCTPERLGNCNLCSCRPQSAYPYMGALARKFLRPEYGFAYEKSLFSMKPILLASEIDDSRPTVVRVYHERPTFVSVLSGKINTVYDLDEVLAQ